MHALPWQTAGSATIRFCQFTRSSSTANLSMREEQPQKQNWLANARPFLLVRRRPTLPSRSAGQYHRPWRKPQGCIPSPARHTALVGMGTRLDLPDGSPIPGMRCPAHAGFTKVLLICRLCRRGRGALRSRKLAEDGFDGRRSEFRGAPAIVFKRPQGGLDLVEGFALVNTRLHFARQPLEELSKLGKLFFSSGGAVTGDVSFDFPAFKLAENFNPTPDVARTDSREKTVLEEVPEEQHFGLGQIDRGIGWQIAVREAEQLHLVAGEVERQFRLERLARQGRMDAPHARLEFPVAFEARREFLLVPAQFAKDRWRRDD